MAGPGIRWNQYVPIWSRWQKGDGLSITTSGARDAISASVGGAPIAQALPMSISGRSWTGSGPGAMASSIDVKNSASSPTEPMLQTERWDSKRPIDTLVYDNVWGLSS